MTYLNYSANSYQKAKEGLIAGNVEPNAESLANFLDIRYLDAAIIMTRLEDDSVVSRPDDQCKREILN